MIKRIENINGIVIKIREFMENDLSISIFADNGKRYDLIVKGARSGKSRRRQHLELFNLVQAVVYKSRSNYYLESIESVDTFHKLKNDYASLMHGYKLLEIVEKSLQINDPMPEIYDHFLDTLKNITQTYNINMVKISDILGFLPSLRNCSNCHRDFKTEEFYINHDSGLVFCALCSQKESESGFYMMNNIEKIELKYRKAIEYFRSSPRRDCKHIQMNENDNEKITHLLDKMLSRHLKLNCSLVES